MKGTFYAYCIMRTVSYTIYKYSSEKLFNETGMTFLNAAGK